MQPGRLTYGIELGKGDEVSSKLNIGDVPRSQIQKVIERLDRETGTIYPLPYLRLMYDAGEITSRQVKNALQQALGGRPRDAKVLIRELRRIMSSEGVS